MSMTTAPLLVYAPVPPDLGAVAAHFTLDLWTAGGFAPSPICYMNSALTRLSITSVADDPIVWFDAYHLPLPYKNGAMTPAAQQGFLSHRKPSSKTLPQPRQQLWSRRRCHLLKKSFHRQPPAHFCCRLAPQMNVQPFQSVTTTSGAGFGRARTGSEWHRQVHLWSTVDDFIYVHGSMSVVHRKYSMFYSNRSFHFYYLITAHI
jgi:hypothetical protein